MKMLSQYKLGDIQLSNRLVMSPMTRSRAINNIPNDMMVEYYRLRAAAGLIITEGVAPSANGLGYARIPGVYNQAQIEGWKKITDAVHAQGGKIFIQLMHTGRVSHSENMEPNSRILAPSAIGMSGKMWTDKKGNQAYPEPLEMTLLDIEQAQEEHVVAAKNAIKAGFDGVELHGANGYLIDQFINTASNKRQDEYGSSLVNHCRFALEVANKVSNAIGPQRTGIRLSPYGVYNDMEIFKGVEETYEYLADELGKLNLLYLHIVDFSSQGAPEVPESVKSKIRNSFGRDTIASGGLDREKAEKIVNENKGDLVAFGQAFLANPDLVYKIKNNLSLNEPDYDTFFTAGEKGYLDYPLALQTG